ncbi:hypothetical protein AM493_19765 [Flavobacterium akiainvivens]|uniref:Membrane-binding protein n=1 Tax=Flavobacterium akiainvivens TaxID=1202724 RepID=A0A0M8ML43_9FLAO|nr:hypothetical protein [Flavobacterium akiainvivens]KOS08037.1 hypothetical protein AM493_19765 [Flavobacterium akiainvivens]SFQ62238.1 hypothetical protein SAMN05444144_11098 [Flavobacterium akiainvivens]
MKYIFLLLTLISIGSAAQDTLSYDEVAVEMSGNVKTILHNGKKFTGWLAWQADSLNCIETVAQGAITGKECTKNVYYKPEIWELKPHTATYRHITSPTVKNSALVKEVTKEPIGRECENCDTGFVTQVNYTLARKPYTGFSTGKDSLYFYDNGTLKYVKTFWDKTQVKEYTELSDFGRHGRYELYSRSGELKLEGWYYYGAKHGPWLDRTTKYSLVEGSYHYGKKTNLWCYYKGDKQVLCEFYSSDKLLYYYTLEYFEDKVVVLRYEKGIPVSEETYKNGHLDEYRRLGGQ